MGIEEFVQQRCGLHSGAAVLPAEVEDGDRQYDAEYDQQGVQDRIAQIITGILLVSFSPSGDEPKASGAIVEEAI